jgi:glyceraldehyde 3-phosphate dehydrogenase
VLDTDGSQLVKVVAWYDNEMSYTYQLVRLVGYIYK